MAELNAIVKTGESGDESDEIGIEENNLPEYKQDVLEDVELPLLVLISHGHAPPLNPRPQLKFDVRDLPNPPKHIRDQFSGTSRRLREWTLADKKFTARRDAIQKEVGEEMRRMVGEKERGDVLPGADGHDAPVEGATETVNASLADDKAGDEGGVFAVPDNEESLEPDSDDKESESDDGLDQDDTSTLRVGVSCTMGKHRSVAMVEELARLSWPGWRVEIQHRDVNKKRGMGKKSGGKESRGTRGGGVPTYLEDD